MAGGRPTLYKPEYCQVAIDFLAGGFSVTALAGEIGVSRSTVFEWASTNAEFSDALKTGQAKAALWWEKALQQVTMTGDGNASAAIFGVKNRSREDWKPDALISQDAVEEVADKIIEVVRATRPE